MLGENSESAQNTKYLFDLIASLVASLLPLLHTRVAIKGLCTHVLYLISRCKETLVS